MRNYISVICPHCGREFGPSNLPMHVKRCPREPERYSEIRASLDDGTGAIRSIPSYKRSGVPNKAHPQTLISYCGGDWESVAKAFGLRFEESQRSASMRATHAKKKARTTESKAEQERRKEQEERDRVMAALAEEAAPRGLPVCRVIDVGREVVYILR